MRNLSYENEFYSQVHSNANHTHFHMKDFALGLGLKQRQKATRKWPISFRCVSLLFLHVILAYCIYTPACNFGLVCLFVVN